MLAICSMSAHCVCACKNCPANRLNDQPYEHSPVGLFGVRARHDVDLAGALPLPQRRSAVYLILPGRPLRSTNVLAVLLLSGLAQFENRFDYGSMTFES